MTEEEEFFAWLDGELDDDAAARVAARVEADPELQAMAEDHRTMQAGLRAAFDPVMEAEPVMPIQAIAPVAANDNRAWWKPSAIAASLAAVLLVGVQIGQGGDVAIAVEQDGRMIAAASLDNALDTQLASAPAGDVRIGLTYRDGEGNICRSFEALAQSGIACRSGDDWAIETLLSNRGQDGDFRMASGGDPRLAAIIDDMIIGEPLDAASERDAKAAGWSSED